MSAVVRRVLGIAIVVSAYAPSIAAQDRPTLEFLDVPDRPRASATIDREASEGLEAVEAELVRFGSSARAYRSAVDRIVRQRLEARRRELSLRYDHAIRVERGLEAHARERSMAELTEFVRRHPSDGDASADAMLRLAELHALAAIDEAERTSAERPDFSEAIRVAERLVRAYPRYAHVDRALYLLGHALSEMNRADEALAAWRALACADRFPYGSPQGELTIEEPPPHPAFGAEERRGPPSIGADPYVACTPAMASPLLAEVWLRIGEHHFDGPNGELAAAIGAYQHVVENPSDPLYAFGLYKLAWSHYRASRFAEALARFEELVDHSDARQRETGRAGSDLREEAVQYIAITLAYDDWNEDGTPDPDQGGPTTLARLADRDLVPDRAWARDVLRRTGEVLFEGARYDEAVAVWRETLRRFPNACDAPDVLLSIARAHRRGGQAERALEVVGEITDVLGSDGACTPAERERALRVAEHALATAAAFHHRRAQELRAREEVEAAHAEYALAVNAYRVYLARFPNADASYALAYDMADALYWSGRYDEAAAAYASVRDSHLDDRLLARAARRVVESLERALAAEVRAGLVVRDAAPPLDDGGRIEPEAVPLALQRVARAREIYVRWVDPETDEEHVRDAYAFNNASLLYRYGFWPEARERFTRLYLERCRGAQASRVGADAFLALIDMARARGDIEEHTRLTSDVRQRACTFDPDGPPVAEGRCEGESPLCDLPLIEADGELARLVRDADALPSITDAGARRARAERIADGLVAIVDRAPNHTDAPLALSRAAHLLSDTAGRPAAAERLYQRIVDEVTPLATADAARRETLDVIVADAHLQLARIAHHTFDVDRALAGYRAIAESPRFARSRTPEITAIRRDALVNAALLASSAGDHARAADAWARAASELDGGEAREALLRGAEERLASGDARGAARELDAWLRDHGAGADALTVRAWWARAEAAAREHDELARERALASTVDAHRRSGASSADPSAALAARAALTLADRRAERTPTTPIRVSAQESVRATVEALERAVRDEAGRSRAVLDGYEEVIAMGRAPESVAALRRQGARYEALVRAVLDADVELPRDLARTLRHAAPAVQRDARERFRDAIRSQLDTLVRPVECRAIERYVLATRLARRDTLATEDAERARERLDAYGVDRVAECLAEARERDATFEPLAPGELDGAHRGLTPPPPDDTAPPALER